MGNVTTLAKRASNARNAAKSTGPRTTSGKARSSANSTRHGITAAAIVLPHVETAKDWEAHRAGVVASLAPVGALETELAERVAALAWRMRRVVRYETAAAAAEQHDAEWIAVRLGKSRDVIARMRADDLEDEPMRYFRPKPLDDLDEESAAATESNELLSRVREMSDDAVVTAEDANGVLFALAEHAGLDPYDVKACAVPGVPDDIDWSDWDGWTGGLIRAAADAFAHRAGKGTGDNLWTDAAWAASKESAETRRAKLAARDELGRLRGKGTLPPADATERVMRYETHLQRMLAVTLADLERVRAMRVVVDS